MKVIKLLGVALLVTAMIAFAGCGNDETDDTDTTLTGDTGVDEADVGDNDLTGDTGGDVDTDTDGDTDTGVTEDSDGATEDDIGADDDRTDLEIFCDTACDYMVDCNAELENPDEIDIEECTSGCLGFINDLNDLEQDGCPEAMIETFTCAFGLSCEDAMAVLNGDVDNMGEDHACYVEWTNSTAICYPPTREELLAKYNAILCNSGAKCMTIEEGDDEGDDEDTMTPEEWLDGCIEEYTIIHNIYTERSEDCFDALAQFTECVEPKECSEFDINREENTACQLEFIKYLTYCNAELIFKDQCSEFCDHIVGCEFDSSDWCLSDCAETYMELAIFGGDDCTDAYQELLNCQTLTSCEELSDEDSEACYTQLEAVYTICGIEE